MITKEVIKVYIKDAIHCTLYYPVKFLFLLTLPIIKILRKRYKYSQKSIVFIGDNYHSFYFLAEALRLRGFKAKSVKINDDFKYATLYHQHVPMNNALAVAKLFFEILLKYDMVHFYSSILLTHKIILRDIFQVEFLKLAGVKIGYTGSGCLDGAMQSEIMQAADNLCDKCVWQNQTNVCGDKINAKKIQQISKLADLFAAEIDLPSKLRTSTIAFPLPLTITLSKNWFEIALPIPEKYKIHTDNDTLIIFTAFGNQKIRQSENKDIKGYKTIKKGIDTIIAEGFKIKHIHATDIPSQDMKYLHYQADIVVDQLNYGSIGDFARCGLLMGKIVISNVSDLMRRHNVAMRDCPVVSANEENFLQVLQHVLTMDPMEREKIKAASREWMLKWFEANGSALRFEKVYDRLILGKTPA